MSQQVERLQQLLSRVQENRHAARGRGGNAPPAAAAAASVAAAPSTGTVAKPSPQAAPASVSARQPTRQIIEETVVAPRSIPTKPAATASVAAAPSPRAAQEVVPDRKSSRDRLSTPLELAVEDELRRAPSEAPTSEFTASRPARPEPSVAEKPHAAAPSRGDGADIVFEPEPVREPARPIAQTVSRHATEVDMTFGAMLRRSLALRPR